MFPYKGTPPKCLNILGWIRLSFKLLQKAYINEGCFKHFGLVDESKKVLSQIVVSIHPILRLYS